MLISFVVLLVNSLISQAANSTVIGEPQPSEVPKVSSCHVIQEGALNGSIKSHDGYPDQPYSFGYRCRYIISIPQGDIEIGIEVGDGQKKSSPVGLRPWDYVVVTDGIRGKEMKYMCDTERYKSLGTNGLDYVALTQKRISRGTPIKFMSTSSMVIIDFCADAYAVDSPKGKRTGFEIQFKSDEILTLPESTLPLTDAEGNERCGRPRAHPSDKENRIINGVIPAAGSWPWICALTDVKVSKAPQFCGCTVLADQWVVTAAHCVKGNYESRPERILIYAGTFNLIEAHKNPEKYGYNVTSVIVHPNYNDPPPSMDNDIALLKLERNISFDSGDVLPICLPRIPVNQRPFGQIGSKGRRKCYVAGWGTVYSGQNPKENGGIVGAGSDILLQVGIEIVSQGDCMEANKNGLEKITERQICGGYDMGFYDACQGDSGGPMICKDGSGVWYLYGVVSWGKQCARPLKYNVYTNVLLQREWMEYTIYRDKNPDE